MSTNPDIAARYAKVVEKWQNESPKLGRPLPFEVPPDYKSNLQACVVWGNATVDAKHFYCDANYGRRGLKSFFWVFPGVFAFLFLLYIPLFDMYDVYGFPTWLIVLVLSAMTYLAYRWWSKLPRWENHVFSRDDGKLYMHLGKEKNGKEFPHEVMDFYDQHFIFQVSQIRYNTFYRLSLVTKDKNGRLSFPIILLNTMDKERTLQGWYFLVRFMDKNWPFSEEDNKDLQEIHDYHIKELGWKFGGILHEDGKREKPAQG